MLDFHLVGGSVKTFRESAEHYLRQWCDAGRKGRFGEDTDWKFVRQFQKDVTCEGLARLCVCYTVARTIPGKDPTHEKYRAFANILNRDRNIYLTLENMPGFIEGRVKELEKHYGKRFLSAITKAFWMVKQHPVIIYDSNARKGLRRVGLSPGSGDYSRYVASWLEFYRRPKVSQQLSAALEWLPKSQASRSLREQGITSGQVRALGVKPWFRDRVTDIYLFSVGESC
jgi:hypothetical protein